jgi:tetratricopeptide (TPR) repeat protein
MRTSRVLVIAVPLLASLVATDVAAEPIFASPPHVVTDEDGQRIVLFLNEPVSGALAARAGDGFEVRVPRSAVAPAIQGQDYGADGWGNGGDAVKHLVLAAGAKGDTSIRIQPSRALHGVDAHSVDDPPRLVIELLAAAATKTPAPTRTPGKSPTPQKSPAPKQSAAPKTEATSAPKGEPKLPPETAPKAAPTKAPPATATPRPRPTVTAHAPANPAPTVTTVVEPVAIAAAPHEPASAEALARATVLTAMAPLNAQKVGRESTAEYGGGHVVGAASSPAPSPAAVPAAPPAAAAPATAPASAPAVAMAPAPPLKIGAAPAFGLGCLWRRFAGIAICVADPKAAPYVGDHTITAMVGALARGKLPEPEDAPPIVTPASTFLEADVLFATRAPEGKLLPVVDAYRRALRKHPDFPEAWRARLNIALAYRAMEFVTEIRTTAGEAAVDPTAGLVRGLAGDLSFVTGKTPLAGEDYRRAADIGGIGACLAARGRARVALTEDNAATAAAELAALGSLCPPELASDAETVWVRGRLALAQHDLVAARTLLEEARKTLGKPDRGAVLADLGAVAEAGNDPKAARKSYEQLLQGDYGARAARQATVRLAILDGVGGDVTAGLKRLERLTPEASDPARRSLVMQSARSALARGAAGDAIATLHEAHVDPTTLGLDDQLLMADAYRGIGLLGEAERVLAAAQASAGPDGLFAARGALALDRGDSGIGLAIGDEWIRARGRNSGALALKARAAALGGDAIAARAAVAAAIMEDEKLTRSLSLDVAEILREREPAIALVLAHEALEPGPTPELPPQRTAAGLAMVGALAEQAGDDDTALAAFTTLTARFGKEPVAADAAYRAARLAAKRLPGGDAAAFDEAARSKDALARRVAGAARDYETIVKPFAKRDATLTNEP